MYVLLVSLFACGPKKESQTATPVPTEQTADNTKQALEFTVYAEHFGADFTMEESIPAAVVLNSPAEYVGKRVRITGTVSDVCQKMGCWMVISDEDKHMRIMTKDHKFFVAKDGAGSDCDIEGTIVQREVEPERVEHFKSEQTEGAPLPEEAATNNIVYEMIAETIAFAKEVEPSE